MGSDCLRNIYFVTIIVTLNAITCDPIPVFCESTRFDSVFNYGWKVQIKLKPWIWTYDKVLFKVREPPEKEYPFLSGRNSTLMSSVFIDRVPACPPNSSPENCQQLTIANELFIMRLMDTDTTQESTVIYRPNKLNQLDIVWPKDYPWNMTATDFWPQEWDHMPLSERPAVYYAKTYEMMYIIKSGLQDAELLFNPISSVNWYKKFQRSKLNTTVRFIGMFTIDNRVIAVGIDPKDTTNEYRIYELNGDQRQYAFKPSPYTLKTFLGCVPNVANPPPDTNTVTNTMATIGSSSSSVSPQLNSVPESEGKTSSTTIVIVVTVILIVVIVLCAVIYFYIRRNANTETIAQRKKMSEKESKATDTETRLMSIETINSSTGFKDK